MVVWASGEDAHWVPSGEDSGLGGEIISQHWPGNASRSPFRADQYGPGKGSLGSPANAVTDPR